MDSREPLDTFETDIKGTPYIVEVLYYYPGTNDWIDSHSIQPNDDPVLEVRLVGINEDGEPDPTIPAPDINGEELLEEYEDLLETHRQAYEPEENYDLRLMDIPF